MAIKFKGFDFIQFDSLLSDEELMVRDTARQFIEDNLIPIIEECNREGRFPRELVQPMAELGFFGATLRGYGCAEMNNVEYGLIMQEMERGDSGVRSFVSVQSALCMYPIHACWVFDEFANRVDRSYGREIVGIREWRDRSQQEVFDAVRTGEGRIAALYCIRRIATKRCRS